MTIELEWHQLPSARGDRGEQKWVGDLRRKVEHHGCITRISTAISSSSSSSCNDTRETRDADGCCRCTPPGVATAPHRIASGKLHWRRQAPATTTEATSVRNAQPRPSDDLGRPYCARLCLLCRSFSWHLIPVDWINLKTLLEFYRIAASSRKTSTYTCIVYVVTAKCTGYVGSKSSAFYSSVASHLSLCMYVYNRRKTCEILKKIPQRSW